MSGFVCIAYRIMRFLEQFCTAKRRRTVEDGGSNEGGDGKTRGGEGI